jgi:exosortase A
MSMEFAPVARPTTGPIEQSTWRGPTAALAFSLSALILIYRGTAASIVTGWSDDPLAHGYLVVPFALYLVWLRRDLLKPFSPTVGYFALPVIAAFAFSWLLGHLADTKLVQQASLVAMIACFVWLILGWNAARILLYPLGLLVFALPFGERFVPPLQDLAARVAVRLLTFSGVPVLLQGHLISLPGSTWKVAEACSGINYLTSSLVIGYLYAGTAYRYWAHRLGFILAAALVPLLANGVRVYGTILIASKAGPESIAGTRHVLFGWLVFAFMMVVLFAVCGRWREAPAGPVLSQQANIHGPKWSWRISAAAGLLVAWLAPLFSLSYEAQALVAKQGRLTASSAWSPVDIGGSPWKPHFPTAKQEFIQTYESNQRFVRMYSAYYSATELRGKLAGANNILFPEPWLVVGQDRRTTEIESQAITVRETHLEGPASSLLVWNWYWVDGTYTQSDYLAQLYLARARLFRHPQEPVAIAIATENRPAFQPETVLQEFARHLSVQNRSDASIASVPSRDRPSISLP